MQPVTRLATVLLLAGCSVESNPKSARVESKEPSVNQVAVSYFEIPVTDLERASAFYAAVFELDFTFERIDGYEMALFPPADHGEGASGALAKGDVYVPTRDGVIVYFTVASIDQTLERVRAQNAPILYPKKDNGIALVAEFQDSEGNRIAVMQPHP